MRGLFRRVETFIEACSVDGEACHRGTRSPDRKRPGYSVLQCGEVAFPESKQYQEVASRTIEEPRPL